MNRKQRRMLKRDLPAEAFGHRATERNIGKGVGVGHGTNTPNLPIIRAVERTEFVQRGVELGHLEPDTSCYKMGKCSILVGTAPGPVLHMSIAHPDRLPSWDEVAKARYELLPENITVAMLLPPKEHYVNVHAFCFQLWQVFPAEFQATP